MEDLHIDIGGETVPVKVSYNNRAKRYGLRIPNARPVPVLTIPRFGNLKTGQKFLDSNIEWLSERLSKKPKTIALSPHTIIPYSGIDHRLISTGELRGRIETVLQDGEWCLAIPGDEEHFERRLTDWLKKKAKIALGEACDYHAKRLGLTYRSISVRDQRTRWGSCSSQARLNFSWRLILAPADVLDYVAAHEVAHLEEMNHGAKFWALVERTCPDMDKHRYWLRENGAKLHAYGSA